ncbi:MAG: hypothetical protein JJ848_005015 [Prochlorococcus marinus CUG1439]|nr:hypothetical protein [Prochlorococcus marinus CUG1439]
MNFTKEEDRAAKKYMDAVTNYSFKLFIGNLLSTVTTAAAIIVPIILAFRFKEFIYLIYLFNYPICLFSMSWLRHSTPLLMKINFMRNFYIFNIFFAVGIILFFINLTSAPGVISTISIGLIASYHILFNELPVAQHKIDIAQNNPAFKSFREKSSSEISK